MGLLTAVRAKLPSPALQPPTQHSASCLNCGTPLIGPFCSSCGQRDIPPHPSVRELAHDAFSELSGWDGRFATTVRALLTRPGMLTREFLEGRRARYLSPVRLYLAASLSYFVLTAAAPNVTLASGEPVYIGIRGGVNPTPADSASMSRAERVANAAGESLQAGRQLTGEERAAMLEEIARAPRFMQPFLRRSVEDPAGYKRSILQALPRTAFVLLPVFAAIVALFYRGRKYPDHLYFAVHLHAFAYTALALIELTKFSRSAIPVLVVATVGLLSIPIYATMAFRRVYGGSLVRTLAKGVVISALYCVSGVAAVLLTIYLVSLGA